MYCCVSLPVVWEGLTEGWRSICIYYSDVRLSGLYLSISDNDIVNQSGFLDNLKNLLAAGYLLKDDAVMADKGFTIEKQLQSIV